jgi:hypothetical protein
LRSDEIAQWEGANISRAAMTLPLDTPPRTVRSEAERPVGIILTRHTPQDKHASEIQNSKTYPKKMLPKTPQHDPNSKTPPYSLICLHDATGNSQAEAQENPVTPWAISRRRGAQRRKPESCIVRALLFPLAAIPENDRQWNSKEEGANYTGLRRHPMAGVATAKKKA